MDALTPDSGLRPEADPEQALDRRAHRNLLLLTCCQAVGQSCNTMMFAATGLSVITFYHRPDLANLPVTMQHIGVMIWVFPAALLMQRIGRSIGFRVGSLFGMAGATVMCIGLYTGNFLIMCGGGLILGYAVACLQMYRFAAAELVPHPLPRQGDFVGHGRRRRRRRDRTQPGARDARSDDADLSCDLCRDSRPALIVFTIMSFISFPSVASAAPTSSQAEIAAPPRPLVDDRQPAALHRVGDGRHAGVRHDVLHHERVAAGHRRLRISAFGSPLGHLHACAGHVRAVVLHRQSDQPVRRHDGDGLGRCADAGRRRRGADRHDRMEFPDRPHRQRRRLEFPVRRRHDAGDDLLPPERARQVPGAQRPPGLQHDRHVELHGGLSAGSTGAGSRSTGFRCC